MSLSPTCTVKDGAGAPQATTNGVDVTASNTITIALQAPAGVDVWTIAQVGADDVIGAAVLTIDPVGKTATFTAEAGPWSRIFQSTVKAAGGATIYSTTFKVCVKTGDGLRLAATNEQFENNASTGWTSIVNARIRSGGGGGSAPTGTGFAHVTSGAQDAASALVDVTNVAHVAQLQLPPDVDYHPRLEPASVQFDTTNYPAIAQWNSRSADGMDVKNSGVTSTKPTIGAVVNNLRESIAFASASSQAFINGGMITGDLLAGSGATDFVLWALFNVSSVQGTALDTSFYQNDGLYCDGTAGFLGMYLQNLSGTFYVGGYVFDGAAKVTKQAFTLNTWHLFQFRKSAGNIYSKLDNGAESIATACSPVANLNGLMRVGQGGSTNYVNGNMHTVLGARGTSIAADTGALGRLQRTRLKLGWDVGITVN